MTPSLANLLAVAHRPLSTAQAALSPSFASAAGPLAPELLGLLQSRNGFYAFGAALHVYPTHSSELSWGLSDWNMPGLWKHAYAAIVDPGLCFAGDIFGNQFSIKSGTVYRLEVETGALEPFAASLEKWAALVVADDRLWTGSLIARRWKEQHGPLPLHQRLHPGVPFVCGGSYENDNLRPIDAADMMAKWGAFASQIKDLPDGAQIKFVFGPKPDC